MNGFSLYCISFFIIFSVNGLCAMDRVLHAAILGRDRGLFDTLVKSPTFDPNVADVDGDVPLSNAILAWTEMKEHQERDFFIHVIKTLLQNPAIKLDYIEGNGRLYSFVHCAIRAQNREIFDILVNSPAFNPNTEGPVGMTPLEYALVEAARGEAPKDFIMYVMKTLLQHSGIDLERKAVRNGVNVTALDMASTLLPDPVYAELLLQHGAKRPPVNIVRAPFGVTDHEVKKALGGSFACATCKKAGCTKRCPCKYAYYCSDDCQCKDWSLHKAKFFNFHKPGQK